jgi:hypothetical protein
MSIKEYHRDHKLLVTFKVREFATRTKGGDSKNAPCTLYRFKIRFQISYICLMLLGA